MAADLIDTITILYLKNTLKCRNYSGPLTIGEDLP